MEVYLHASLTLVLDRDEWPASRPGRFTSEEIAPGTRCVGGSWVGRKALDGANEIIYKSEPGEWRVKYSSLKIWAHIHTYTYIYIAADCCTKM